jgi:hypothetical protein
MGITLGSGERGREIGLVLHKSRRLADVYERIGIVSAKKIRGAKTVKSTFVIA